MKTVDVALGDRSYPIYIGSGLLTGKGELLRKHVPGKQVGWEGRENKMDIIGRSGCPGGLGAAQHTRRSTAWAHGTQLRGP